MLILYLSIVYDIQLRLEQKHGFIIHKRVNFTHHSSESSLNADTHFYTFDPEKSFSDKEFSTILDVVDLVL